jgi:enoyl-CoA hydratase
VSDAPEEHALIDEAEGIITVTLNRPDKLGAISPDVTTALWKATNALGSRSDLRVMIITGTGRYFSAGLDMKLGHGGSVPGPDALGMEYRRGYRGHHLLYDEFEAIEKPIILAANGPCVGAGTEMALSCDFRFCTPETHWGLPEIRSMGAIPGSGGVSRLTRLVGAHWAKWIAMAAQEVTAEHARMIGLVHAIHPAQELMDRVREFAQQLIALDPEALALAKLTIDMCDPQDQQTARNIERLANTDLSHRRSGQPGAGYAGPKREQL